MHNLISKTFLNKNPPNKYCVLKMIMGLEVFNNDVVSMCNPHFGVQSNPLFNIHVSFFAMSQVRQEINWMIQEKKKEFEHSRKNHQRALESMQASLEAEARAKEEALRIKKKNEADINEMEIALDHAKN